MLVIIMTSRRIQGSGGDIPTHFTADNSSAFIAHLFQLLSPCLAPVLGCSVLQGVLPARGQVTNRAIPSIGLLLPEIELSYCFQLRFKDGVYLEMLLVTSTYLNPEGGG